MESRAGRRRNPCLRSGRQSPGGNMPHTHDDAVFAPGDERV
jgi:hypothetical protein